MERKPLLRRSQSTRISRTYTFNDGHPVFNRSRSEAIIGGSLYQKAAALVDLAEDGLGLPEEILDQSSFEDAAKLYFFYTHCEFFFSLNYYAIILLCFFEEPLWCAKHSEPSCNDREHYFLGELPYLSGVVSIIFEVVTLVLLMMHTLFPILYEGSRIYWRKPLHRFKTIALLILAADILVYALYLSHTTPQELPFRIAPYVRVICFVLNIRDLTRSVLVIAGMLSTYVNVLALGLLFLLFSSWLALIIFQDTPQGAKIFTSYGDTLYQMFLLFTTSNNPDVWIPAYKASRWYCAFFILYVLLGVYFVTNLILAVVYDSFKTQLAKQVAQMDAMRKSVLVKAFKVIDFQGQGFLNKEQCTCLFKELNKYRTVPEINKEDFESIFDELDDRKDFKIHLDEFTELCHAIALRFPKGDTPSCFEIFQFYHSATSVKLKLFVRSPIFGYLITLALLFNLRAVVIETTLDLEDSSTQIFWQRVEFVFGWLYVLEMALKVYTYGFVNYWREGQHRFDFIITWVIVIGETTTFLSLNWMAFLSHSEWLRYLLLARVLRLVRILMHVKRYRAFVATFLSLIPSLMPYLGTVFCVMCIYSSLGVQIFGGIVNAGSTNLAGTELSEDDYLLFNFNDYPNAMVTLFNLLVMNNWQTWMQSYTYLTQTSWTLAYFISFYLITVVLILNLVVAFVLEAFFAELAFEEDDQGGDVQVEGKCETPRAAVPNTRRRVDVLLHRMLSTELERSVESKE